jgi:hypothetical protein
MFHQAGQASWACGTRQDANLAQPEAGIARTTNEVLPSDFAGPVVTAAAGPCERSHAFRHPSKMSFTWHSEVERAGLQLTVEARDIRLTPCAELPGPGAASGREGLATGFATAAGLPLR